MQYVSKFDAKGCTTGETSERRTSKLGMPTHHLKTFKKASKIAKQRRGSLHKKQSKTVGSNRRGKTRVNKKKLSAARRQLGKEGGCKFLVMDPIRNV